MMPGYGQFCPVAKAMEILDERWTLLVIRELLSGSTRFNELRRGVPRMSPTLLSRRLQYLERVGLVDRVVDGGAISYRATERCLELRPIIEAIGVWGTRWIGDLGEEDLDPHLLFWDIRRTISVEHWPRGRTVLEVDFDDVDPSVQHWWLVVAGEDVDVCDFDPGHPVSATLRTGLATMTRIWRGDLPWDRALRTEQIRIDGPRETVRRVPSWLGLSRLAVLAGPDRPYADADQR